MTISRYEGIDCRRFLLPRDITFIAARYRAAFFFDASAHGFDYCADIGDISASIRPISAEAALCFRHHLLNAHCKCYWLFIYHWLQMANISAPNDILSITSLAGPAAFCCEPPLGLPRPPAQRAEDVAFRFSITRCCERLMRTTGIALLSYTQARF